MIRNDKERQRKKNDKRQFMHNIGEEFRRVKNEIKEQDYGVAQNKRKRNNERESCRLRKRIHFCTYL